MHTHAHVLAKHMSKKQTEIFFKHPLAQAQTHASEPRDGYCKSFPSLTLHWWCLLQDRKLEIGLKADMREAEAETSQKQRRQTVPMQKNLPFCAWVRAYVCCVCVLVLIEVLTALFLFIAANWNSTICDAHLFPGIKHRLSFFKPYFSYWFTFF